VKKSFVRLMKRVLLLACVENDVYLLSLLCYVSVVIYKGKLEEKCEVKCVPGKEVNLRKEIE